MLRYVLNKGAKGTGTPIGGITPMGYRKVAEGVYVKEGEQSGKVGRLSNTHNDALVYLLEGGDPSTVPVDLRADLVDRGLFSKWKLTLEGEKRAKAYQESQRARKADHHGYQLLRDAANVSVPELQAMLRNQERRHAEAHGVDAKRAADAHKRTRAMKVLLELARVRSAIDGQDLGPFQKRQKMAAAEEYAAKQLQAVPRAKYAAPPEVAPAAEPQVTRFTIGEKPKEPVAPAPEPVMPDKPLRASRGEGYGGQKLSPGTVVRAADFGVDAGGDTHLVVVETKKRFYKYDGMSFGVGKNRGHVFTYTFRRLTPEEKLAQEEKDAAAARVTASHKALLTAAELVRKGGVYPPKGTPQPGGVHFYYQGKENAIYGGGAAFQVDGDRVWHLRGNGADGDDWGFNNLPGVIAHYLDDPGLARELLKIAESLNLEMVKRERESPPGWERMPESEVKPEQPALVVPAEKAAKVVEPQDWTQDTYNYGTPRWTSPSGDVWILGPKPGDKNQTYKVGSKEAELLETYETKERAFQVAREWEYPETVVQPDPAARPRRSYREIAESKLEPLPEGLGLVKVSMDDIPWESAAAAFSGTSWTPEDRGARTRWDYARHILAVEEDMARLAKTPEQRERLETELDSYRRVYRQMLLNYLHSHANVVSAFIAGPSKFPAARMEKRSDAAHKHLERLFDWSKKARNRMRMNLVGGGPITAADPDAVGKLQRQLAAAEELQVKMKEANAIVRKKGLTDEQKVEQLTALGSISENVARELLKPDFAGRVGFADYQLANNNANIKRLKGRIADVGALQARPTREVSFEGGTAVDNSEDNRVQIFFDAKPDEATRGKLKARGFRWAPSVGAWQRQRTATALQAVRDVLGVSLTTIAPVPAPDTPDSAAIVATMPKEPEPEAAPEQPAAVDKKAGP